MKEDLQTILDCMIGVDGGVSFVRLKWFLEQCQQRYEHHGNDAPGDLKILEAVNLLARVIKAVNKTSEVTP